VRDQTVSTIIEDYRGFRFSGPLAWNRLTSHWVIADMKRQKLSLEHVHTVLLLYGVPGRFAQRTLQLPY